MRDHVNNMQLVHLGTLALSGVTPGKSSWLDTRGFDAATLILVNNTITDAGTAAGFTATAQHSDSTADASAVDTAAADAVNGANTVVVTDDAADDVIAGAVGYKGSKRYVRFNIVGTTGTSAGVSVYGLLNRAARAPATLVGTKVAAT